MNLFNHLSVIIPVGPNDQAWRQLLDDLTLFGSKLEIILSSCETAPVDFKLPENAQWLNVKQGRARQLNAGTKLAARDMIWFLHADSRVTPGVLPVVENHLQTNSSSLGYFQLRFAGDGPKQTRLNAWAANLRSRYLGLPFGDQGFMLKKAIFEQLHGFDETVAPGEDLDFVVRWQAAGLHLQELPTELITSARRYQQHGWWVTTLRHLWLTWHLTRQAKQRLVLA